MKFRNKYNPEDRMEIFTKAGTEVVPVFAMNETGDYVIEVGKRNICDEIESYKDSTDMAIITNQLLAGNVSVSQVFNNGGFYATENMFYDSTLFPQTMAEYQRIMRNAMSSYNSIPKEIREQFNSIDDFVSSSNDKLQNVFNNYFNKQSNKSNNIVEEGDEK